MRCFLLPPLLLLLVACNAPVLDQTSAAEANRAVALLELNGIAADKAELREGQWQVAVAADEASSAASLADAYNLPRTPRPSLHDLFGKKGLISTPGEEQIRWLIGLNGELSTALEGIDGVLDAQVQVGLPRMQQPDRPPMPVAAAVLLRHHSAYDVPAARPAIQRFVADAAGGLDPARVSVAFVPVTPDASLLAARADRHARSWRRAWLSVAGLLLAGAVFVGMRQRLRGLDPLRWWAALPRHQGPPSPPAPPPAPLPPRPGSAGAA